MVGFEFGFRIPAHHDSGVAGGVDFGLPISMLSWKNWGCSPKTAGMQPVARITCKRKHRAALFVAVAKRMKFARWLMHGRSRCFLTSLSPAQQRNLERHIELVNDRTLLILEILRNGRAAMRWAKLRVELAAAVREYAPGAPLVSERQTGGYRRPWRPW